MRKKMLVLFISMLVLDFVIILAMTTRGIVEYKTGLIFSIIATFFVGFAIFKMDKEELPVEEENTAEAAQ